MSLVRRTLIIIAVVFTAACVLAWKYRKPMIYSAFITFGSSKCTVRDVLTAKANLVTGDDLQKEIRAKSRRLRVDPDGLELWATPDGNYWDVKAHTVISVLSEQARDIYTNAPAQSIRPGDVVFDCGASIGSFTRKALKAGAKRVIAVEPGPESLKCFRRNFEQEIRNGTVVVVAKGIYDHEGEVAFTNNQKSPMGDHIVSNPPPEAAGRLLRIPITTIDKLVDELGLSSVGFIKMDIEGAERYALKGAERTLKRFHPRMAICTYHLRDDPEVIPAVVEGFNAGYRMQCGASSITRVGHGGFAPSVMFFN